MKIVILDGYCANHGDFSWDELKAYGEVEVYDRTPREKVIERAKDAEIIITNKVTLKGEILGLLPKLKYIGILATGYNIIDVEDTRRRGITVTNVPAYSTDSVAQMVFAHILNIANRVEYYSDKDRQGEWTKASDFCFWDTPLFELSGKTLGIVGLGNIGCKVARIAKEFGMDVFAYTSKNATDLPPGIQKTTFDGLLAISDILSLHCPLTENIREIINKESLAKMRKGSILINTSRGPLVNDVDVAQALSTKHLAAYGADVLSQEPPQQDNPLLQQPNAYITPHIAWATYAARQRLITSALDNVKSFIEGKPQNVVN